jgi:hypothetical protein
VGEWKVGSDLNSEGIDSFAPARFRPLGLPIYACHDVAVAKVGRSRPRGSIREQAI